MIHSQHKPKMRSFLPLLAVFAFTFIASAAGATYVQELLETMKNKFQDIPGPDSDKFAIAWGNEISTYERRFDRNAPIYKFMIAPNVPSTIYEYTDADGADYKAAVYKYGYFDKCADANMPDGVVNWAFTETNLMKCFRKDGSADECRQPESGIKWKRCRFTVKCDNGKC